MLGIIRWNQAVSSMIYFTHCIYYALCAEASVSFDSDRPRLMGPLSLFFKPLLGIFHPLDILLFGDNDDLRKIPETALRAMENATANALESAVITNKTFIQELMKSSLIDIASGDRAATHAEVLKTILTSIVEIAAAQEFVPQSTNLFQSTPFDTPQQANNNSPTQQWSPQSTISTGNTLGSSVAPLLYSSQGYVTAAPDLPPLDTELMPFTSIVDEPPANIPPSSFVVRQTTLDLDQANAWKTLSLFALGVSNSYGRVPATTQQELNDQFIYAFLSSRYPYSPEVFASLSLDTLCFVNITQHLYTPPRDAFSPKALAKMLFLRWSDTPLGITKILLDYFRISCYIFAHPSAEYKKKHPNWEEFIQQFRLPMSRLSAPSIGKISHSISNIASVYLRNPEDVSEYSNMMTSQSDAPTTEDVDDNKPITLEDAMKIIDMYDFQPDEIYDIFGVGLPPTLPTITARITLGPPNKLLRGL